MDFAHGIWCCLMRCVTGKGGGNFRLSSAKVVRQPEDGSCLFHAMAYGMGKRECVSKGVCVHPLARVCMRS